MGPNVGALKYIHVLHLLVSNSCMSCVGEGGERIAHGIIGIPVVILTYKKHYAEEK